MIFERVESGRYVAKVADDLFVHIVRNRFKTWDAYSSEEDWFYYSTNPISTDSQTLKEAKQDAEAYIARISK